MIVYDTQRRPVELGAGIGHGGEATVYRVVNQPDRLAKIYEPEPRPNYAGKLDWMVTHPPENPTQTLGHASLAWPGGLIFDSRRRLKGYWMPYISQTVPLLEVFNPRRRAEVLPQFNRRYLLRTARNLAAALSALHHSGYVAGDINESNILVTPTALVTLIDTDSFQVREERDGKEIIHPCPVGKPEYTPPELQRQALAEVIRQPDHDAFGLAVLIFQLLMEGSHPFRAQWLPAGDPPPMEVRIANGAYPYTQTPAYPVLPPKNALKIETLHPWLVELFYRCFVDGHRDPRWRPGPELWVRALTEAEHALILCAQGHYYSGHLSECPYCARQQKRAAQQPLAGNRPQPGWAAAGRGRTGKTNSPNRAGMPPTWARRSATPAAAAANMQRNPAAAAVVSPAAGIPAAPAVATSSSTAGPARAAPQAPVGGAAVFSNRFGPWFWPRTTASTPSGISSLFTFPSGSVPGVLRSRPLIRPGALRVWAKQQAYRSLTIGGGQGALAGAVPGALVGLVAWMSNISLAWVLLFALGGAAGGLLRGWKPGHKLASVIGRYIGWKLFWQIMGGLIGMTVGGALGLVFVWAIIPVFLGLFLGARVGFTLGKKLFQVGSTLGWERIWGAVSALGFAGLGFGLVHLIGLVGMNTFGANLAEGLLPFANNGSVWWAIVWMLAGAAGGGLAGGLAGIQTDLIGRFTGLVD